MVAPHDPHTGLRPLGPFGEGYCTVCHFVQALTADGRIERHVRGALLNGATEACKGSEKKPPALTPHTSYRARFRYDAPTAECTTCKRTVPLTHDLRFTRHHTSTIQYEWCTRSYYRPPEGTTINYPRGSRSR